MLKLVNVDIINNNESKKFNKLISWIRCGSECFKLAQPNPTRIAYQVKVILDINNIFVNS